MTLIPLAVPIADSVPAVRPAPLDRLPESTEDSPSLRLAAEWLVGHPTNTATAYRRNLQAWASPCTDLGAARTRWPSPSGTTSTSGSNTSPPSRSRAPAGRLCRSVGLPAGVPPHSLRHFYATETLRLGTVLRDVQDALGHADPRTLWRYDRSRHNLDQSPNSCSPAPSPPT